MSDLQDLVRMRLTMLPIQAMSLLLKLIYGYRVEGAENLPREGPYIALMNERAPLGTLLSAVANVSLLKEPALRRRTLYFVGEELWAIPWLRRNFDTVVPSTFPLLVQGGGLLGLGLLDGLRALEKGWVVVINPAGDMPRDGRPLPLQGGAAWLALHSAAPLVPILAGAGVYDTWPPWSVPPSLHGQVVLRVGKPFKVAEAPLDTVTDQDITTANTRILAEIDRLWYGPGGIDRWAGPPQRNGIPAERHIDLGTALQEHRRSQTASWRPAPEPSRRSSSLWKSWRKGIPLLLWRCPVCRTNDALVHKRPLFRSQSLHCEACGVRWAVQRQVAQDFRLEVVAGPPDLLGLNMALSSWYDELKKVLEPVSIAAHDTSLQPGEEVYLAATDVRLMSSRTNSLFGSWNDRKPPKSKTLAPAQAGHYGVLGTGQLILTNLRLIWKGSQGGLDFWWSDVTYIGLRLYFLLRINYGLTPYWFTFGHDNALKWLAYAATVAKRIAAEDGHTVTTSPF